MSVTRFFAPLSLLALGAYALLTRGIGSLLPYHHDEYKWALAADPSYGMTDTIPHPFLARFLYEQWGALVGYDQLRLLPILASLGLLVFLYIWMRRTFGKGEALAGLALFVLSTYALLGSVQVDIDGIFLPLAALAAFAGYGRWLTGTTVQKRHTGLMLLVAALIVGFMLKLSFILVPATLVLHLVFVKRSLVFALLARTDVRWGLAIACVFSGLALFLLHDYVNFIRYVDNFTAFSGRAYGQVAFQTIKALIMLSPLIPVGIVLGWRYRRDLSLWYLFLAANILFYFVLFDFTHRTFDRYLLFIVLPGTVIAGVAYARRLAGLTASVRMRLMTAVAVGTIIIGAISWWLMTLPHRVIPLIPKSAFVEAFLKGEWNFLIPISGGSGPMGFYVPVDVILLLFILAGIGFLGYILRPRLAPYALALLISSSLVMSFFVTHELLTGTMYGSAPRVTQALLATLPAHAAEGSVLTYNDIGAYELYERGKYSARFYPHEEFIEGNLVRLERHNGLFLVVGMPELNPTSVYAQFFGGCRALETAADGQIRGALYDCRP